jgi:hypothetical protein
MTMDSFTPGLLRCVVTALVIGLAVASHHAMAAEDRLPEDPRWLTYRGGEGPGAGKHVVLIAADQEYRSEYSMPMLARLLAKHHGFDCTVLFALNKDGDVYPTQKNRQDDKTITHDIPGIEQLDTCDLVILFSRLITLPPEQMKHVYDYLDSGKPIIGIRTANHGFIGFEYVKDGGISPTASMDIVGPYDPPESGFHYDKLGIKPHQPAFCE